MEERYKYPNKLYQPFSTCLPNPKVKSIIKQVSKLIIVYDIIQSDVNSENRKIKDSNIKKNIAINIHRYGNNVFR